MGGSGSLGSCSIFSGVFKAEEIDGVGDMEQDISQS